MAASAPPATPSATNAPNPAIERLGGVIGCFLVDLDRAVSNGTRVVTGDIENALHQKLQSCGDKRRQARQLNAVAKGTQAYMERVQAVLTKNFDKFERYVRRNIVAVPPDLLAFLEPVEQPTDLSAKCGSTQNKQNNNGGEDDGSAKLSPLERREKQLEEELVGLRQQLRALEEDTQRLALEERAIAASAEHFQRVTTKLEFLDALPNSTISPLKRTVEHVGALQQSLSAMEAVRNQLEEETRAFKRQKLETRDAFKNLRQRFVTRSAATSIQSLEELKRLNVALTDS